MILARAATSLAATTSGVRSSPATPARLSSRPARVFARGAALRSKPAGPVATRCAAAAEPPANGAAKDDEVEMASFGQEYAAQSWPKWESLKKTSMVAPSSRQRKAMGKKLKKMGARDVMSAYDWEKLTFMRDGWELRTVEPRVAVPRKTSDKERQNALEYVKLKHELVADTSVISGFVLCCLFLLDLEYSTCFSFGLGAAFAVAYVRLLSAEVDNLQSGEQMIAEVGTDAQWDPMKMAAPLRMALAPLLIAISVNFEGSLAHQGLTAFDVDAMPLMPALGGFAMYKIAAVNQAMRLAIRDATERSIKQEKRIESGEYLQ